MCFHALRSVCLVPLQPTLNTKCWYIRRVMSSWGAKYSGSSVTFQRTNCLNLQCRNASQARAGNKQIIWWNHAVTKETWAADTQLPVVCYLPPQPALAHLFPSGSTWVQALLPLTLSTLYNWYWLLLLHAGFLQMEVIHSSETLLHIQTTWCYMATVTTIAVKTKNPKLD
jgi:hypothetical protein